VVEAWAEKIEVSGHGSNYYLFPGTEKRLFREKILFSSVLNHIPSFCFQYQQLPIPSFRFQYQQIPSPSFCFHTNNSQVHLFASNTTTPNSFISLSYQQLPSPSFRFQYQQLPNPSFAFIPTTPKSFISLSYQQLPIPSFRFQYQQLVGMKAMIVFVFHYYYCSVDKHLVCDSLIEQISEINMKNKTLPTYFIASSSTSPSSRSN